MQLTQRQRTDALQHRGGAGAAWHIVTSAAEHAQQVVSSNGGHTIGGSQMEIPWRNDNDQRIHIHVVTISSKTLPHFDIFLQRAIFQGLRGSARVRHESCLVRFLQLCFSEKICAGWWLTYPSEKYESQLGC